VPACATGEETYSIAILLREEMARAGVNHPVRIFGGDIDDEGLDEARQARYPESIERHVSPERLQRHFTKKGNVYHHSLLKNPPFSRLDLISCRNFMIYLETSLQERLLPLFHYALRPRGYLFLGPSENLGKVGGLFRAVDKKHRIFQRKDAAVPPPAFPGAFGLPPRFSEAEARPRQGTGAVSGFPNLGRELERALISRFAPAALLVNETGDILYISGRTGEYLEPAAGAPNSNILAMARRGLRPELRVALHSAVKKQKEVVRRRIEVGVNGGTKLVNIVVRPWENGGQGSELYLVMLEEDRSSRISPPSRGRAARERAAGARAGERAITVLEEELKSTKDRLRTTVEELEASNEELKSSNEELLSMNEELQSANEEMQSSKEELQALNEELETVNSELGRKLEEIDRAHSSRAPRSRPSS
jgi:two-component system CheB/CheR fusion protein